MHSKLFDENNNNDNNNNSNTNNDKKGKIIPPKKMEEIAQEFILALQSSHTSIGNYSNTIAFDPFQLAIARGNSEVAAILLQNGALHWKTDANTQKGNFYQLLIFLYPLD